MKVLTSLLPHCLTHSPLFPLRRLFLSATVLKSLALELAILTGHLLLYPAGMTQERRIAVLPATPEDPPTDSPPGAKHRPVILLHGFIDNRSVFVLLRRSLLQHGRRHVESLNYSPLTCDIKVAAELLGRHVEDVCARTGRSEIDIVGHSLGGLIARYYVQRGGGSHRVRTLVTMGTPHSGTVIAPIADAHPIVRQMRPGSALLEELRAPAPGIRTRFVAFWSELDQVMIPVETARIDHADLQVLNVRVAGVGHLALPVHPAVAGAVRTALDDETETDTAAKPVTDTGSPTPDKRSGASVA